MSLTWMNRPHTPISRLIKKCLELAGWTIILNPPPSPKFVAIAAPHTSNADFWPGLFWKWATQSPIHFIAKEQLFRFPVGLFMRAVGGIPVNRSKAKSNFVSSVAEVIANKDEIMLVIAPEGTRSYTQHWRTGFYYMALEAGVPLGVIVLDWPNKVIGVSGYVQPTGDIEADFGKIREILGDAKGRKPENQGPVIPKPKNKSN